MSRPRKDACVNNNMELSDSFSEEKSEQDVLGTSSDQVTSKQINNDASLKIENDAYLSDQENNEPDEIQSNTEEQFTKNEDLCVACGHVSAYEFFSFPINANIRQQWAKFCDINLDKIKPHFRLCDGHFKPEDYQISMQRKVLMPTSVPTLQPKVKHNSTPSISQSFQFGTDVISFSMPKLNMNTSQNTICSSDLEKNTTTADAPNKQLSRNFKDITNNQDTIPPKAAKSKKHLKHEKCHLLEKKLRSEIFRLKIRCSRLEDTVANFENKIKQQVEECFVTRANTVGNVARDVQNSTSSINASSENSRHNLCYTEEARTDQRPVKDPLVGSAKHFTEDGNTTNSSTPPPETSIDDLQKIEVKSELTEEVMLDEPAEKVAEDNLIVNSTISPPEISTDPLHNAKANPTQCSIRVVDAETSRNVTENNRCPLTTSSAENNSNSRRCSTEDSLEQHFEEAPPEPEYSDEDSQSPNSTIPSSEKSLESRNNAEARAGCSKNQETSGRRPMPRSAKQKKHLPSVKKPTRNSSNVSNKEEVLIRNSFIYCCDICGMMCSCERDWSRHQQEHSKPFHCRVCDKQFTYKRDLIGHELTHSEKKRFKCRICDARFENYHSRWRHEHLHVERPGFQCADCGKVLSSKGSLITHLRVHSGVKPFSCKTCRKRFAQKGNLTQHQRIHSEEKPFKCRICNQRFSQKGNKAQHESTHVEGPRFECAHCGNKFRTKSALANHISYKCVL
ncbi:zinc finger protein 184-like isoform X6 [Planococcus citri]|uniref:zinc finger protein 184-like isoform X6 n=1 Tax=Planococcus citri TaxID=170843 RepID=UPI0031F78612